MCEIINHMDGQFVDTPASINLPQNWTCNNCITPTGRYTVLGFDACDIGELINALLVRPAFVVLGSGASIGIAPGYSALRDIIHNRAYAVGGFATDLSPGPEVIRLYGGSDKYAKASHYVKHLGAGTLRGLLIDELQVRRVPEFSNPYRAFNLANPRTCLFNLNVDGLAERTCDRVTVLSPHGNLIAIQSYAAQLSERVRACLQYGLDCQGLGSLCAGLTLSVPEHSAITSKRPEYRLAERLFGACESVVIVGYSFGRIDKTVDDSETLNFLTTQLKQQPKRVFVVDVAPEHTAGLINRYAPKVRVTPITARWRPLGLAMRHVVKSRRDLRKLEWSSVSQLVCEAYKRACDIEDESRSSNGQSDTALLTIALDRCGCFASPPSAREIAHLLTA